MQAENATQPVSLAADYARVWRLLPARFRACVVGLLAANVLGAGLEVLGLWLLTALISVITPGVGAPSGSMARALGHLVSADQGEAGALRLVALTGLAFLFKNVFMGALAWVEASFAFGLQSDLGNRALAGTLQRDYEEVTRRQPAEYLNLITADLYLVVMHFALPTLTLLSECFLMVGIVAFLFWTEPALTAAIVLAVGGMGWALMVASRKVIAGVGQRRQQLEDDRIRRLREIFGHLREVYVYGAAQQASGQLQAGMGQIAKVYRVYQMMSTGPRFLLEVIMIGVLLAAVVVGLHHGERHALIVSVGVFAASGFRMLIGANRLVMSTQGIRFARPAMQRVIAAAEPPPAHAAPAGAAATRAGARAPEALALRGVHYRYEGARAPVLAGVELRLARGSLVGIKGGSGGGKTTLLELLAGLRRADAGEVLLDDRPLADPRRELFRVVGYVGQSPAVFSETIRRNVAYGYPDPEVDDARVWAALEAAHLASFVRSLPGGLDFELGGSVTSLSGGQAQRLALARALYAQCRFLLLDEPTSALDPETEEDVVATFRELARDCGVLIVSHRPKPLECCDRVYEMRDGQLVLT